MAEYPTEYMSIVSSVAEEPALDPRRLMASTARTEYIASEAIKQVKQTYGFAVNISNQTVEQGEAMVGLEEHVNGLLRKVVNLNGEVAGLIAKDKKRDKTERQLKKQVKKLSDELMKCKRSNRPARAPKKDNELRRGTIIPNQTIIDSTCGLPEEVRLQAQRYRPGPHNN